MNLVHQNGHRYLLSVSRDDLGAISNALNEVCNGVQIQEPEFQTRLGYTRERLSGILGQIGSFLRAEPSKTFEVADAWADGGSVQVRCMGAYGDPADMNSAEARAFAALLNRSADQADAIFTPHQSSEPTPASGTSPAGQAPRLP